MYVFHEKRTAAVLAHEVATRLLGTWKRNNAARSTISIADLSSSGYFLLLLAGFLEVKSCVMRFIGMNVAVPMTISICLVCATKT